MHDNCYIRIQTGTSNRESADWVRLIANMYQRYCERKGWTINNFSCQKHSDDVSYDWAEFQVIGDMALNYLVCESGVHRIVRLSPFDTQKRRHTDFALVFVAETNEHFGNGFKDKLKKDIIRSYFQYPEPFVKDYSTSCQTRFVHNVLDGEIQQFIDERLREKENTDRYQIYDFMTWWIQNKDSVGPPANAMPEVAHQIWNQAMLQCAKLKCFSCAKRISLTKDDLNGIFMHDNGEDLPYHCSADTIHRLIEQSSPIEGKK